MIVTEGILAAQKTFDFLQLKTRFQCFAMTANYIKIHLTGKEGGASIQPSGRWAYSKLRQSPSPCNKNNYLHTWGGMRGRIEQDYKLNLCQKVNKFFLRSFQPFSKGCGPYCLVWGKWKVKKVCRLGILYKIFAEETNTKKMRMDFQFWGCYLICNYAKQKI